MAKRRPAASIKDVALPMVMEERSPTKTGGLEAEKPKKVAKRKKPNYGRMTLPSMSTRKLVSKLERVAGEPGTVLLNNMLVEIQPDHVGWKVRDEASIALLKEYGYDDVDEDFEIQYIRLHVELDKQDDGYYKLLSVAHAGSADQVRHLLGKLCEDNGINDNEIEFRVWRDALYPFVHVSEGVDRMGMDFVQQVANYVEKVGADRIALLINPPAEMRQWGDREKQVLSAKFRSPAYYEARGIDQHD